ncbi:cytochrome c [Paenalcaligenes hominis]|uniref:c-type cytochrome n=1 Tax=Paenalcaligenes hominis TaxID=643674 RepID=UPI0035239A4D
MTRNKFSRLPFVSMLAAVGLSAAMSPAVAEGLDAEAIERGKASSTTCVACHQADGSGMNIPGGESWPRLAGLDRDYIVAQLKAFKDGSRNNASMLAFANMLNDEQMVDIASYYASLPVKANTPPAVDEAVLSHGEKLATHGDWSRYIVACTTCHGVGNQGNGSVFPALAGQHPGYIAQQIKAWQDGTRKNDPQELMATIAKRMDENDIAAVSAWLAAQPAKGQE